MNLARPDDSRDDEREPTCDVAIATDRTVPHLDPDNAHLLAEFERRGRRARPVVWDDPAFDAGDVRVCVVRSTWDYLDRRDEFLAWAERTAERTSLWNRPATLRWNSHKRYLEDLSRRGVPILPTEFVERGADAVLRDVLEDRGWAEAVVKPAVSASGRDTFRVSARGGAIESAGDRFAELVSRRDVLVQEFQPAVERSGELSLVYVDGRFAHAVRQTPREGEFRVQREFGGRLERVRPETAALLIGDRVLEAGPAAPLYARIDLLTDLRGELRLNELELIEPCLHLAVAPDTVARLADAILARTEERAPWLR
ncbi:MAG: RimK family alpha-L-glutamate ligase [Planctomycetota bacterium JB042]